MINKKNELFLLFFILAALLLGGAIYAYLLGDTLRYWDEEHYLLLVQNLHHGIYSFDGKLPTTFQAPGYPFFLFIFSFISNNLIFLRFANFLALATTIVLLYLLLQKRAGPIAALFGALMASTFPLFFYAAGTFYPQTFASTLFIAFFWLIFNTEKVSSKKKFTAGLLIGLLILTVPSFGLFLPFFLMYPLFIKNEKKIKSSLLLLLGVFCILSPWTLRNAISFDRFIIVSSNLGVNLLLGNSQNTSFNSGVNVNLNEYVKKTEHLDEFAQDSYYREQAFKWIHDNPFQALQLYLLKMLNFFNFKNELASTKEGSGLRDFLSLISYYPLLFLSIARIASFRRYPLSHFEWYLVLIFILAPFLQALFFTRIRFRIPFDFLMIYFAAVFLKNLLGNVKAKEAG